MRLGVGKKQEERLIIICLLLDIGKPDAARPYLDLVIEGADSDKLVIEAKDLLPSAGE